MVAKKPRIVIIGAGMAGLTAANKLYKAASSKDLIELSIVEGGNRIGGRILTTEFGGDRVEVGATWIHGIGGSPVYKIAQEIEALDSEQPWERMDGFPEDPITIAEGGFQPDPSIVSSISLVYKELMEFAQGKLGSEEKVSKIAAKAAQNCRPNGCKGLSVGSFLRCGLSLYWVSNRGDRETIDDELTDDKKWSRRSLEEGVFAMHENTERTYTSADDLFDLDFNAESEYCEFPDEQITIAKGYSCVIESLASILPSGLIQLGKKVEKIKWTEHCETAGGEDNLPVKLYFQDGSTMVADHVIVTVSLGVLKEEGSGMFQPPLPSFKTDAISRLGFGVVNKLFLQFEQTQETSVSPFLQMVFDQSPSAIKDRKIPWWMRRTVSLCPIYKNSRVLLAWFAGKEALELESLTDFEIISGVSSTLAGFGVKFEPKSGFENLEKKEYNSNSHCCNGHSKGDKVIHGGMVKVLKSKWGTNPLFRGSYSYVATGSSGEDLDIMAEPLPKAPGSCGTPLQILFAGEATHRTHYSTTHGAYFSGIREAERLLQHYGWASIAAATVDPLHFTT